MRNDKDNKACGAEDVKRLFCPLPERSNKGDMGRVLCICGTVDSTGIGMCGAAYFAAAAAYRCGAGIVQIFTERENYAPLAALVPEAVFILYDKDGNAVDVCSRLAEEIKKADSVVLGCGLGKSPMSREIVRTALSCVESPVLIDADALNVMSEDESLWDLISNEQRVRTVVTPHPGEMSRLTKISVDEILNDTVSAARALVHRRGVTCLLKDHNTVVTDGESVYINHTGNAGMATAGMGDVLAGIIGALLARLDESVAHDSVMYRAAVGAYLHGLAGDVASGRVGEYPLMASDVLAAIPDALAQSIK